MKLNLGAGNNILKGYINLDYIHDNGINVVHDLTQLPLPFKDNSFNEIKAYNILEHLPNYLPLMKELHRIMKINGILKIKVPHRSGHGAYHPLHIRFFDYFAFNNLCISNNKHSKENELNLFKIKKIKLLLYKGWNIHNYIMQPIINSIPRLYEGSVLCSLFPAKRIYVELVKIK